MSRDLAQKFADDVVALGPSESSPDCVFRVEGQPIPVHRKRLANYNTTFGQLFNDEWSTLDEMPIENTPYEAFAALIKFIYVGNVDIPQKFACDILYLAHLYDVKPLMGLCVERIVEKLNVSGVVMALELANEMDLNELAVTCIEFISKHTEEVLQLEVERDCDLETLRLIVECTERRSCDEWTVAKFCLLWSVEMCRTKNIDVDGPNVRNELEDCFGMIRWKKLKRSQFWCVYSGEAYENMFTESEAKDILGHFMADDD